MVVAGRPAMIKLCELCGAEALFHCAADSAFLCRPCDSKVHASNFLVARHVRRILCRGCNSDTGNSISGPVSPVLTRKCTRCKSCFSLLSSSSSSSFCSSLSSDRVSSCELSSTDAAGEKKSMGSRRRLTTAENRIRGEAKGIFVIWCEKLGLRGNCRHGVVSSACFALERLTTTVLPYRVSLAAAFWFGVRVSEEVVTWQNPRRVEEVSGIPSKIIVAVELRLAHALMRLRRRKGRWRWRVDSDMEEGWAETHGA